MSKTIRSRAAFEAKWATGAGEHKDRRRPRGGNRNTSRELIEEHLEEMEYADERRYWPKFAREEKRQHCRQCDRWLEEFEMDYFFDLCVDCAARLDRDNQEEEARN